MGKKCVEVVVVVVMRFPESTYNNEVEKSKQGLTTMWDIPGHKERARVGFMLRYQ